MGLLLAVPICPIVSLWSQRGGNLGLLLTVPICTIPSHLASVGDSSVGDYRFDILGFLRQTGGDGGGMLGGFSLAGWYRCWEGASVSKAGPFNSSRPPSVTPSVARGLNSLPNPIPNSGSHPPPQLPHGCHLPHQHQSGSTWTIKRPWCQRRRAFLLS